MRILRILGRIQARILAPAARRDYAVCVMLPLSSFILAWAIGNFFTVELTPGSPLEQACRTMTPEAENITFAGYSSRANWWHFLVTVPLCLYTLRWTANRLFGVGGLRSSTAPILDLFAAPSLRAKATDRLRAALLDPRNLAAALLLAILIHVADLYEVMSIHAAGMAFEGCPRERDWSVFFLVPEAGVSRTANLAQVILAYSSQFVVATLALLIFILLLRHNVYYLASIYQRYRAQRNMPWIVLDFEDPDLCFGQGELHSVFNVQIFFLALAGLFVSVSRYSNIAPEAISEAYEAAGKAAGENPGLLEAPGILVNFFNALRWPEIFPDVGQIILGVAWTTCFVITSLPAFVKFLPFRDQRYRDTTIRPYLAQFVPPENPPDPLEMDNEAITLLARKFANNSFWPVGDGKATVLFTLANAVLLFIFVPVPLESWGLIVFDLLLLALVSALLTQGIFILFRQALRYIDKRLIDVK